MARTIKEIYNEIITEKESMATLSDLAYNKKPEETHADALLTDLNSNSKVSIWRLWAFVVAVVISFHEKMWDLFKAEVETKLQAIPGTANWLAQECKKFQFYEDEEENDFAFNSDGTYGYETIDPDRQIVKRVAVTSLWGNTVVKVASVDGNEDPLPLTSGQLSAFNGYLHAIQYAGTTVTSSSKASDKLKISMSVYYNALIAKTVVQQKVEEAVNHYLANLEFDGVFKIIRLIDAVQAVDGVTDITIDSIEGRPDGTVEFSVIKRVYNPVSGYIEIDPEYALSDTIDYRVE